MRFFSTINQAHRRKGLHQRLPMYQILGAAILIIITLVIMGDPPIPRDLNYKYQLDKRLAEYPLVPVASRLVEFSVERVREVYRWNLTAKTMAHGLPVLKGKETAVNFATFFIVLGCVACVMIFFAKERRRVGVGLLILVIAGCHLFSNAPAYMKFVSLPSELIPHVSAALVVRADPGHTSGMARDTNAGLKDLSDRYWQQYVHFTRQRMGEAGEVLPGMKRIWFGVSGVIYVIPFAVVLGLLAALVALLQTLGWALLLTAPFAVAVALIDGRAGLKVKDHVLVPLLIVHGLLLLLSPLLPLVLYTATAVHAAETQLGLLLIGSLFPIVSVSAAWILLKRKGWLGVHRVHRTRAWREDHGLAELPGGKGGDLRSGVFDVGSLDQRGLGRLKK